MHRLRESRPSLAQIFRVLWISAVAGLALAACTPASTVKRACPRGNLGLTALKDKDHVQRFSAGIDGPVTTAMQTSSPPSCAVVVVADNRISTINRYGDPFDLVGRSFYGAEGSPDIDPVAWTRLYVGSISKTVTALAMIRLAEESLPTGGIGTGPPVSLLDRPLVDLYPPVVDVPEWADFTPRQYLAHATGVTNWPNPMNDAAIAGLPATAGPNAGIHPRWAFAVYRDTMPRITGFTGQFDALYSNIGYSLVGAAIDWQVVDAPASSEVGYEKYVFEKIALNDNKVGEPTMVSMCLGTPWRAPEVDNLARGYSTANIPFGPPNFSGWEGPPGGWTMTIGDLGRLMIAINTRARMSQPSFDDMLDNVATGPLLGTTNWGLGVWRLPTGTDFLYGKGGDITGFTSDFMMYRDAGVGAGIVCNQNGMDHPSLRQALRTIVDACLETGARPAYCSPP